jgi:hypothetical protein
MANLGNVYVLIHSHSDGVDVEVFKKKKNANKALKELAEENYEKDDICNVEDGCAWVEYSYVRN